MDQAQEVSKQLTALLRAMQVTKYIKEDNIPCKIDEGLYLGSLGAAKNKRALESLNITHILTVSGSLPLDHPNDFFYKIIDIPDKVDVNISQYFDGCFEYIEEGKKEGGVLVHCLVGKSRSVTIVVAYLMKKYSMSVSEALSHVKSKRRVASPNSGFMSQLRAFEDTLKGFQSASANEESSPA